MWVTVRALAGTAMLAFAALAPQMSGHSGAASPSSCASLKSCALQVLTIINQDRAHYGVAPLKLTMPQTRGKLSCAGSLGHSMAMAQSGTIWHVNGRFPKASFPKDICVHTTLMGENVGESSYGDVGHDVTAIDALMMGEPHSRSTCASTVTHACNIVNPRYHAVGIAVVQLNGSSWLTEDFVR